MANPNLAIIIVNYNAGRWLQDCLRSVFLRVMDLDFEVIVVDNGSFDDSLNGAFEDYPNVRVIRNPTNRGFARAVNQGVKAASGKYILLLNPDTILLNRQCISWVRFMDENPKVGISGAKVFDDESRKTIQYSCRRFPSLANYFFNRRSFLTRLFPHNRSSQKYLMSDWHHSKLSEVDWVSGCCMLIRRKLMNQIGLLDEDYPLFSEDVDLCYRAHKAGWKVVYYPLVEVAHYTGSIRSQSGIQSLIARHRSLWHFCKKYYKEHVLLRGLIFVGVWTRLGWLLLARFLKKAAHPLFDAMMIQMSVALSFTLRHLWEFPWTLRAILSYLDVAGPYAFIQIFFLYMFNLYHRPVTGQNDYLDALPPVIKATSLGTLMLVFTAFFDRQFVLPRSIIVFSWMFNILLFVGWRWLRIYHVHKKQKFKRVLIYGTGALAKIANDELRRCVTLSYQSIGYLRPMKNERLCVDTAAILGSIEDIDSLIQQYGIEEIVFASDIRREQEIVELMAKCKTVHVNTRLAPDLYESALGLAPMGHFQMPLLDPEKRGTASYASLKRLLDIAGASILLVLTSPLMGLIALKLKLDGFQSILSQTSRMGKNKTAFTLYTFQKSPIATPSDENIYQMTPFGRFLRLTKLDKLPQLFNVMKGDMSFVGPQPELISDTQRLEKEVAHFGMRHRVRPGITGWAQVGLKYPTTFEHYHEKLQYDLYYIKHISFTFDCKILLKSIWMILSGQGAH